MADTKITALTENTTPILTDIWPMVDDPAGTPVTNKVTGTNMKAMLNKGNLLLSLTPQAYTPPATIYATLDTVTGTSTPAEAIPVLDFDDTTVEYADWYGLMPRTYTGNGITITIVWSAAQATNVAAFAAAFRRVADDAEDLDTTAQTYDYNTSADLTPASVVGEVAYDTIAFTDGADMDSVAAGEYFIFRVKRVAPSGTDITGDCSIHLIEIRETP
jgi:hypothetical protein